MKRVLVSALKAYRLIVSPMYGQTCRYYPSCSAYALGAVETHGSVRGTWLALRRLARCHPWCAGGVDLVPRPDRYRWWGRAEGTDGTDGDDVPPAGETGVATASTVSMSPSDARPVLRGV